MIISDLQHCELAAGVQELNQVEGGFQFHFPTISNLVTYLKVEAVANHYANTEIIKNLQTIAMPGVAYSGGEMLIKSTAISY